MTTTGVPDEGAPDAGVDQRRLERWLAPALRAVGAVRVDGFSRPKSGFSAETWMFDAHFERDGSARSERLVLRKETDDPPVYPTQVAGKECEVEIQYRTMRAIADHSDVPVAPLVGYEDDVSVLGSPFFVMGFVAGEVPVESPLYTVEGFFVDATPARRRAMIEDGLRVLARVHTIDWRVAGLEWLAPQGAEPGTEQQVQVWEGYARRELAGREHPVLERGFEWLHAGLDRLGDIGPKRGSAADRAIGLCWGDARVRAT